MEQKSQAHQILKRVGVDRGQTVLDFGCGYGAYTVPAAEIVGKQGRVYALDKDKGALDALMQRGSLMGLRNIKKMETSGELEIGLSDESIDVVLLFDVFHSFYFPKIEDRRKLLSEISRIMRPFAILCLSIWPNQIELENKDEIENANFYLEKEIYETPCDDIRGVEIRRVLNFRKGIMLSYVSNQSRRIHYEQSSRS